MQVKLCDAIPEHLRGCLRLGAIQIYTFTFTFIELQVLLLACMPLLFITANIGLGVVVLFRIGADVRCSDDREWCGYGYDGKCAWIVVGITICCVFL